MLPGMLRACGFGSFFTHANMLWGCEIFLQKNCITFVICKNKQQQLINEIMIDNSVLHKTMYCLYNDHRKYIFCCVKRNKTVIICVILIKKNVDVCFKKNALFR